MKNMLIGYCGVFIQSVNYSVPPFTHIKAHTEKKKFLYEQVKHATLQKQRHTYNKYVKGAHSMSLVSSAKHWRILYTSGAFVSPR